jgi:hypothetical protein
MSHRPPATTLEEARRNCTLGALDLELLRDFWRETSDARAENRDFRQDLRELLQQPDAQPILVHGHQGCGKSTEINKVLSELGPLWLVVKLDAHGVLPVSGNEAADVLLAVCTRMVEVAKEHRLALNEDALKPIVAFFDKVTETSTESHAAGLDIQAGADASQTFLSKLFGLRAKLVSDLRFGSRSEKSTVHNVRQNKGQLRDYVNALGLAVEAAWQEKATDRGRLLVVVENLDKLGLADAHNIFVKDAPLLASIRLRSILTIPVFTQHCSEASVIRDNFPAILSVPMIKVHEPDGGPCLPGRAVLREIVRARVASSLLPDDALDHLIENTGGVLRDLFSIILSTLSLKPVRASKRIDKAFIELALGGMVSDIGLRISYPHEDKKAPTPLLERLAEIARQQAQGLTIAPQADPDIQLLLKSGALLEYNGNRWLGVHPLALRYLKNLRIDVGEAR